MRDAMTAAEKLARIRELVEDQRKLEVFQEGQRFFIDPTPGRSYVFDKIADLVERTPEKRTDG